MKKTTAIWAFCFMLGSATPSYALIIDAATLAAKISDWVGKVSDATTNISQHVSQAKQLSAQGINKKMLFDLGVDKFNTFAMPVIKKKMSQLTKGTKQKNKEKLEAEQEQYVTAQNQYYTVKIEMTQASIKETTEKKAEKEREKNETKAKAAQLKQAYEQVKHIPGQSEQAYDEYITAEMEYKALETACKELEGLQKILAAQLTVLQTEKAKVGTEADPKYVSFQERIEELDADEEDETFVDKTEGAEELEWSMQNQDDIVDKFSPTEEDYKDFMERYFYDPEKLSSAADEKSRIEHQTKIDAATRERKYTLVNTAAHLLQVTASLRREIPVRTTIIDEYFENTPKAANELEAISSYSATRIENMRALLMYAKLQSARLQYMAARALLDAEMEKTPNGNYLEFNLDKYILTKEYVDDLIKKAGTANEAVTATESFEVNAEEYQWLEGGDTND